MLRKFVLENVRQVMEHTSNLALSSSASANSGNDIDGTRMDDESASWDGACHARHQPTANVSPPPLPASLCCIVSPVPRVRSVSRLGHLTNDQGCHDHPGAHGERLRTLYTSPHCPSAVQWRAELRSRVAKTLH